MTPFRLMKSVPNFRVSILGFTPLRDRKFRELLPTSEKLGRLTGTATTTSERVFPKAAVGCDVFEGYGKVGGECFAGPSRAPVECEG